MATPNFQPNPVQNYLEQFSGFEPGTDSYMSGLNAFISKNIDLLPHIGLAPAEIFSLLTNSVKHDNELNAPALVPNRNDEYSVQRFYTPDSTNPQVNGSLNPKAILRLPGIGERYKIDDYILIYHDEETQNFQIQVLNIDQDGRIQFVSQNPEQTQITLTNLSGSNRGQRIEFNHAPVNNASGDKEPWHVSLDIFPRLIKPTINPTISATIQTTKTFPDRKPAFYATYGNIP